MGEQKGDWVVRRGVELARYLARGVVAVAALGVLTGCERRAANDTAAERSGDYRGVAIAPPASAMGAHPPAADGSGNRANRSERTNRGDAGCGCAPADPLCTCL